MAIDPTEDLRRALVPLMPSIAAAVVAAGEPTWTTTEMQRDFEPLGFAAPLIVVRRRADGAKAPWNSLTLPASTSTGRPTEMDAPCPANYSARDLQALGYDMHKPHNYLVIDGDGLFDSHLLDRYNDNVATLCGASVTLFDVAPQGAPFCPDCYNVLLERTGLTL